ncbi:MAG: hypothetical protein C0397_05810, partial [Odoribacter sp.]|nr:hypothetical protein [Odoribacter sp.]
MRFIKKTLSIVKKVIKFLKKILFWLKDYNGILGVVIAGISLYIGYLSLDISNKSITISKATSERDSVTSIQMDKNRRKDSILARDNNYRDSIQQQNMVLLLKKYNELADRLLQTQIDAGKPKFNLVPISCKDTVIKDDITVNNQKFRFPFLLFNYQNYALRPAFELSLNYTFFYPNSKQKYLNSINIKSEITESMRFTTIVPVVPSIDKDFFYLKLVLSWEDRLFGIKKDSSIISLFYKNNTPLD